MKTVKPKKFLGQHFLKDLKIAQDIADTVDACPRIPVLEVGPGMGVMTHFLVRKDRPLKVVEIDFGLFAHQLSPTGRKHHRRRFPENASGTDVRRTAVRTYGQLPL